MTDIYVNIPNLPHDWPFTQCTLSVLYRREEDEWHGIVLEWGLEAFAETQEALQDELREMIVAQLAFAVQMKQPELLEQPAEPLYWRIFDRERTALQRHMVTGTPADPNADVTIGTVSIPEELVAEYQKQKPFKRQRYGSG
jgi:hypothetical protein